MTTHLNLPSPLSTIISTSYDPEQCPSLDTKFYSCLPIEKVISPPYGRMIYTKSDMSLRTLDFIIEKFTRSE